MAQINERLLFASVLNIVVSAVIYAYFWHGLVAEFFTAFSIGVGINMFLAGLGFFSWLLKKKPGVGIVVPGGIDEQAKPREFVKK